VGDYYIVTPVDGPGFPAALGANFASFTSRQDISPTPRPVINGYRLRLGSQIEIESSGEFSTTGTPNLTLGHYIGSEAGAITTVIAESAAIATGNNAASWTWHLEWSGIVTGTGVAGEVVGDGFLDLGTSLTAISRSPIPTSSAQKMFPWDTTTAKAIGVCATWSANSSSNAIRTLKHRVKLHN